MNSSNNSLNSAPSAPRAGQIFLTFSFLKPLTADTTPQLPSPLKLRDSVTYDPTMMYSSKSSN